MLRTMSRRFAALLWLLIALLPLRGLAHELMAPGLAAADLALPNPLVEMAEPAPCHQTAAAAQPAEAAPAHPAGHHCADCDLCHGVLALPASPRWPASPAPLTSLAPLRLGQVVAVPADGIYRPPRR